LGNEGISDRVIHIPNTCVVLPEGFGLIRRGLTISTVVNATSGVVRSTFVRPAVMGKFIFPALVVITTNGYKVYDSIFNASEVCDFSSPYLNGLPVIQLTNE
jgi:hypothetical protein